MNEAVRAPIVMIHGAFCGGWAFSKFKAPFEAEGYRVLAPSLRHHDAPSRDDPPPGLGGTSMRDFMLDLEALLDALQVPPILIGHSMGGLLAQMLAARRPVAALILLAPSAPWGVPPSGLGEIATASSLWMAGAQWHRPLRPLYRVASAHALDRLPLSERSDVFARFVSESGRATFEIWHWPFDWHRATDVAAHRTTAPVLTLAGGRDQVNPPETARRIARRYRTRSAITEFPSMSHWLLGEPGWEEVAQTTLDWLKEELV